MTLNITVLTPEVIFQGADYRLFDVNSNQPDVMPSTKAVILTTMDWVGFVTYTGIGRVGTTHTSDFIREWLASIDHLTFENVVEIIRRSSSSWVRSYAPGRRHTFVVAAFVDGTAVATIISNFERWHGATTNSVSMEFFTSSVVCGGRPEVIVTGQRDAVLRQQRRSLQRLVAANSHDPARVRRALADTISSAATSRPDLISEDCFVYSQDIHGRGQEEVFGRTRTDLPHAIPASSRGQIERLLDEQFGAGQWTMGGATFASSRDSSDPPAPCSLSLAENDTDTGYALVPLAVPDGKRATARAVNGNGAVVGEATPNWRGPSYPCWWPREDDIVLLRHLGGLGGSAFAVNDSGLIVGKSETPDRTSKACVWTLDGGSEVLESVVGRHSGARAVNDRGDIAGWLSVHPEEGGQQHFRPGFWPHGGTPLALTDLGGAWGEAVDIDPEGLMVVTLHEGSEVEAALWNGHDLLRLGHMSHLVRAFYPKRLTLDGTVIGIAIMRDASREIAMREATGHWTSFGSESHGRELAASDQQGNLVGRETVGHYGVPWIWLSQTGTFDRLPHFSHHHHQPTMISSQGWITGSATSDNCSHPLLWIPNRRRGEGPTATRTPSPS